MEQKKEIEENADKLRDRDFLPGVLRIIEGMGSISIREVERFMVEKTIKRQDPAQGTLYIRTEEGSGYAVRISSVRKKRTRLIKRGNIPFRAGEHPEIEISAAKSRGIWKRMVDRVRIKLEDFACAMGTGSMVVLHDGSKVAGRVYIAFIRALATAAEEAKPEAECAPKDKGPGRGRSFDGKDCAMLREERKPLPCRSGAWLFAERVMVRGRVRARGNQKSRRISEGVEEGCLQSINNWKLSHLKINFTELEIVGEGGERERIEFSACVWYRATPEEAWQNGSMVVWSEGWCVEVSPLRREDFERLLAVMQEVFVSRFQPGA